MIITHDIKDTQAFIRSHKAAGKSIAFVPTMGNLHAGHLSLIQQGRQHADIVIASIFVNPLQFGPNEDFDSYPRTFEQDQLQLKSLGTDLLFNPDIDVIYPNGRETHSTVAVNPELTGRLCGNSRPTHFLGVTTVVNKLLNIVQPDIAIFGKKDYQQLMVIRKMVADLCMPVDIIGGEIVRESNGLAMSSRNGYLTNQEKEQAAQLRQVILATQQSLQAGTTNLEQLQQESVNRLIESGFKIDYFVIVRQEDLAPATPQDQQLLIAAACWLGKPRLLDNQEVTLTSLA